VNELSSAEILANIATLFVLIFVVGITTTPKKGDSEFAKTAKFIGRWTLTATLGLAVIMAALALIWFKQ
jgi:hypothetical protein